jgi:hypothetical protein
MRIRIKAKPGARENKIEKLDDGSFVVSVKEPPEKGLANKGIAREVAKYFGVSALRVKVISGFSSKIKVIDLS